MEKNCYEDIINEVSKKLADKVIGTEQELIKRAPMIDSDINDIIQEVGQQTCKMVLEQTRDQIVKKKRRRRTNHPQKRRNII